MRKERKDLINKRKIAYVYLLHRMFEGNPALLLKVMRVTGVTVDDLQDWDSDYREAVYQTIQEEDSRGVKLKDQEDVPSIKSIKEKVLRRINAIALSSDDPARLAQVYKILSEHEDTDDRKEQSVLDAINESIKPRSGKKDEHVTMLERMRQENMLSPAPPKKRGRPKKVQEPEAQAPEAQAAEESAEEMQTETEE